MADRGIRGIHTTNDLPGCPKGGLLLGTDKTDNLWGGEGDDGVRGLGGKDLIGGGDGNDVIYGGDGDDVELFDGKGADAIYGGDGNDYIESPQTTSQTSSTAAKARTATLLKRSIMRTAVARRQHSDKVLDYLGHW